MQKSVIFVKIHFKINMLKKNTGEYRGEYKGALHSISNLEVLHIAYQI